MIGSLDGKLCSHHDDKSHEQRLKYYYRHVHHERLRAWNRVRGSIRKVIAVRGHAAKSQLFADEHDEPKLLDYSPDPFSLPSRSVHIARAAQSESDPFDVVIVGGGCVGAQVALESARRGLSCCLMEANDFGSGTSNSSTKLIHGGYRYLEAAFRHRSVSHFRAFVQCVRERRFFRLSGGNLLTYSVGMMYPLPSRLKCLAPFSKRYIFLMTHDYLSQALIGWKRNSHVPRLGPLLTLDTAQYMVPTLASLRRNYGRNKWSFKIYFDGAHFDHRSVLHVLQTAAQPNYTSGFAPATICNHTAVVRANRTSNSEHIQSVTAVDKVNNIEINVYGRTFVNATGAFSDRTVRTLGDYLSPGPLARGQSSGTDASYHRRIEPSAGIHVAFPEGILGTHSRSCGLVVPGNNNRLCFVLPYRGVVIAGTTEASEAPTAKPCVTDSEVWDLCRVIADGLRLNANDLKDSVVAVWKGYRPLIRPPDRRYTLLPIFRKNRLLSRGFEIYKDGPNQITSCGGKWTTARLMGEHTVNALLNLKPCPLLSPGIPKKVQPRRDTPRRSIRDFIPSLRRPEIIEEELSTHEKILAARLQAKWDLARAREGASRYTPWSASIPNSYALYSRRLTELEARDEVARLSKLFSSTHSPERHSSVSDSGSSLGSHLLNATRWIFPWLSPCEREPMSTIQEDTLTRMIHQYGYYTEPLLQTGHKKGRNIYLCDSDYLKSEIDWIIDREYVCSLDDVIIRRLGVPFTGVEKAVKLVPSVAHEMALAERWTRGRLREEIQSCSLALQRMVGKPSVELQTMASSGNVPPEIDSEWLWNIT